MSFLSSEQSHPIQQISSFPYSPTTAFQRKYSTPLSLRRILITYMKYRTTADRSKYPHQIVKILHKRLCKTGRCKCDRFLGIFDHIENCQDLECTICKRLRNSSGRRAVDLKGSFGYKISSCDRPDINQYYPHRFKRLKVGSVETQYIQLSPLTPAKEKAPAEDIVMAENLSDDDLCVESSTPIFLKKTSVPLYSSELEINRVEEEKVVLGKSNTPNQAIKTDRNIGGVSIFEFLTENEIQEHLSSLRTSTDQDIKEIKMVKPCDDNTCNLCGNQNLKFSPKPIYCLSCTGRIKEGLVYYCTFDEKGSKSCVCAPCHNHGGHITMDGKTIPKFRFQKEKNDLGDEEPWVQCDKCRGWQHQICALYNDKNDLSGNMEYICPKCYLVRIKSGDHVPIKNVPIFGAKNLPVTKLSDYIENRLLNCLNQDKKERAKVSQKNFDEVPEAKDLIVRVVVSANKVLKVNEQFWQIFSNVKYPSEFLYRSKVILVFQKIEGVDICIFAMYVQEYGSKCRPPNQRSVYISHIDSVKHFQPNIRSACGEALRTFAYQEILIGYFEYCKKRGFTTAYIWSCPPLKGDDYVFYCHPKTQKTPKLDILRQWYKSMLNKAFKENIVVGLTNLYDHYFVPNEESNVKVSAARLPNFDGDYWSSAAIGMINKSEKRNKENSKKSKEVISRRTLRAFGHKEISEDTTKDILLMQQLGEIILPSKEDFIMVHLQVTCTNCREPILSKPRWICKKCENVTLCSKCQERLGNTHSSRSGGNHPIYKVSVSDDVAIDTEDSDSILTTTLFDDKNSFLSFCQGDEQRFPYQFDELRRAKHSSMMILYHLHGSIKKTIQDCGEKVGNIEPFTNKKTGLRSVRGCSRFRMRIDTLSHLKGH